MLRRTLDSRRIESLQLTPAANLLELQRTTLDLPLKDRDWALYEPSLDDARGVNTAEILQKELDQAYQGPFMKRFFAGNTASGKSTEITRALRGLRKPYAKVRIDIRDRVNPSDLEAHEILLGCVFATCDYMANLKLQAAPDEELVERIGRWTLKTEYVEQEDIKKSTEKEGHAGFTRLQVIGAKAQRKSTSSNSFSTTWREEQRKCLAELVELSNDFFSECTEILRATADSPDLVVVVEELDKTYDLKRLEQILSNETLWRQIGVHLICNIPSAAQFSDLGSSLSLPIRRIYDVPIYNPDHSRNEEGFAAISRALSKRASANLFAEGQEERLILASGGNLRTLFNLVNESSNFAAVRHRKTELEYDGSGQIEKEDVTTAINTMRAQYRDRLGESIVNVDHEVSWDDKIDRLVAIYHEDSGSDRPDRVLASLLKAGAVLVFNKTVRYAVHPLVVDYLAANQKITKSEDGTVLGGSR